MGLIDVRTELDGGDNGEGDCRGGGGESGGRILGRDCSPDRSWYLSRRPPDPSIETYK